MHAGSALVSSGQRGHYGLEVCGAGQLQLLLRVQYGNENRQGHESEESSAHEATVV